VRVWRSPKPEIFVLTPRFLFEQFIGRANPQPNVLLLGTCIASSHAQDSIQMSSAVRPPRRDGNSFRAPRSGNVATARRPISSAEQRNDRAAWVPRIVPENQAPRLRRMTAVCLRIRLRSGEYVVDGLGNSVQMCRNKPRGHTRNCDGSLRHTGLANRSRLRGSTDC